MRSGRQIRKALVEDPVLFCSLCFVAAATAAAVLAPALSPYGAAGLEESRILQGPSWEHWMGTDGLGRDLLTRVLFGARVSIAVGAGTALIALIIGTAYGLVSGYAGGRVDSAMMRLVDVFYALPDLLIFILLSLVLGRTIGGVLLSLGFVTWVRFARIARGQVLQAKQLAYVEGARAAGAGGCRVVLRHILPNIAGPILVTLTFSIPAAILAESTLSFIGLGINDPYSEWGTSWGTLMQDGWRAMRSFPHVILFPSAAVFLTILAFNVLGNALQDVLDPRRR
jgi:ABC-type dipeptide/oligopeptide/nickel transport system permease subunit